MSDNSRCRICNGASPASLGQVEYFSGFAWEVFHCGVCGCRFTKHDESIYDRLHASGAISCYRDYQELGAKCGALFQKRDVANLRALLCETPKYRYIVEQVECSPVGIRLLEVGCSRGYLTSYSILSRRQILGCDVSPEAVQSARSMFGDSFVLSGSPEIQARAPYDLIYHVGMIGCVSDPVGLTASLISMLRPGGLLMFNAPNLESCYLSGQLWLDTAAPPDVVTLFPSGFWKRQFIRHVQVDESIETRSPDQNVQIALRKIRGQKWEQPVPRNLDASPFPSTATHLRASGFWERAFVKAARLTRLSQLFPRQPSEFGIYVKMKKVA